MTEEPLFAFVLMPFDQAFNDRYHFGIKQVAKDLGILAERVDEQIYSEGILERIYCQIDAAHIVIADMTGKNPNVFYEVGYAHGRKKLTILLTSDVDLIPFDLKHHRHVVYGDSIATLKERLREELSWAKEQVEKSRKSRIRISANTVGGELKKTDLFANGEIYFTIDFTNDSKQTSPEIHALYFYCTERWTVRQDDRELPKTESDVPKYDKRNFIAPPVRRLAPAAWAQVRFTTNATLARSFLGEEIRDKYKVTGTSMLRIVTDEGSFDHDIAVNAEIEEYPF